MLEQAEALDRAAVERDSADPTALRDLSITLGERARIALDCGRLGDAAALAEDAMQLDERRFAADADNRTVILDLLLSQRTLAALRVRQGRTHGAQRMLESALRMVADRLLEEDDDDLSESALYTLHALAENALTMGDTPAALHWCERGVEQARARAAHAPDSTEAQSALAISLDKLADLHSACGDARAALATLDEVRTLMTRIAPATASYLRRRNRTAAEIKYAEALSAQGRHAQARALLESSLAARRALVDETQSSARSLRDLSIALDAISRLALAEDDPQRALPSLNEAVYLDRALFARGPDDPVATRNLVISVQTLADVHRRLSDLDAAAEGYAEALDLLKPLLAAAPDDSRARRDLSAILERLGDLHILRSDFKAARRAHSEAVAIDRAHHAQRHDDGTARDLAISLERLGASLVGDGRVEDGEAALLEALALREALVTKQADTVGLHRELAVSQKKLIIVWGRLGRTAEAERMVTHARAGLQAALLRWPDDAGLTAELGAVEAGYAI